MLSPVVYNEKSGLVIACPVTKQTKNYPFEVAIPEGSGAQGIILADQIKSLDWRSRRSQFYCKAPVSAVSEVTAKLSALLKTEFE